MKLLSFGTGCADFAQIFLKGHVITKSTKVQKVKNFKNMLAIDKNQQSRAENVVGPEDPLPCPMEDRVKQNKSSISNKMFRVETFSSS